MKDYAKKKWDKFKVRFKYYFLDLKEKEIRLKIFKYREKCKECSRYKYHQLQGDPISYSYHFDLSSYSNENRERHWKEKIHKRYYMSIRKVILIRPSKTSRQLN
jgi:hypothetical protein